MGQELGQLRMIILKLSQHMPQRATEWLLAGILLSWGVTCLYVPAAVWNGPAYSGLRGMADQTTWGVFAAGLGMVRLAALFVNGAVRRSPHARLIGAALSMFLWLQLSLAMFQGEVQAIAIAIYPWFLLTDLFNVHRAAQDARVSDTRAKEAIKAQGASRDAVSPQH